MRRAGGHRILCEAATRLISRAVRWIPKLKNRFKSKRGIALPDKINVVIAVLTVANVFAAFLQWRAASLQAEVAHAQVLPHLSIVRVNRSDTPSATEPGMIDFAIKNDGGATANIIALPRTKLVFHGLRDSNFVVAECQFDSAVVFVGSPTTEAVASISSNRFRVDRLNELMQSIGNREWQYVDPISIVRIEYFDVLGKKHTDYFEFDQHTRVRKLESIEGDAEWKASDAEGRCNLSWRYVDNIDKMAAFLGTLKKWAKPTPIPRG